MKLLSNQRPLYADFILLIMGTGCIALGIQWFYDPSGFVTGGFTGIAIIIRQLSLEVTEGGIPLWLTNLALNIPVFLIALKIKGKGFVGKTGFATAMLSFWLYVIPAVDMSQGDLILASVFGGGISGIGIGLVFLAKATTGGTDMVAVLIQHKLRHYSVVLIMEFLDGAIVFAGLFVFGLKSGLYAMIAIFIVSKISDALMEGLKYSKAAFIITEQYEQVAQSLMENLERGVTGLNAKGMYSGGEKCMLYCVVSKKEIVDLKELVARIDRNAFVIVTDVREVLGEGFLMP
ncbi:MAG: YitT family protein [Lachnospiraceae bacterium]|nr:YitT family protein [Lachnospiraceae bacterium]